MLDSTGWLLTRGKVGCGSAGQQMLACKSTQYTRVEYSEHHSAILGLSCQSDKGNAQATPALLSAKNPPSPALSPPHKHPCHCDERTKADRFTNVSYDLAMRVLLFHRPQLLGQGLRQKNRKLLNFLDDLHDGLGQGEGPVLQRP